MWTLIKLAVSLVVIASVGYCTFYVDVGGQTIAGHFSEIWRTPVVQKKVTRLQSSVKDDLGRRWEEVGTKAKKKMSSAKVPSQDELTAEDREKLNQLFAKVAASEEKSD